MSKVGSVAGCAEVVIEGNETVFIGLSGSHPRLWLPIPVLVNQFLSPHISLSSFTFTTWLTCTLNMKAVCPQTWLHGVTIRTTV